jgi:HEAT repeat protein
MKRIKLSSGLLGGVLVLAALAVGVDARSDGSGATPTSGVSAVYGNIPSDQVEFLSSEDHLKAVAMSGVPTAVWETLEHGERVECVDCIPYVEPLLYDANAKNREIAAWWLRRRMFGVFGPGETYERTVTTLASDGDPVRRAYAAEALGEFLEGAGIAPLTTALKGDGDARVRAAAARALGRLNDDGGGALTAALSDGDATVRAAALDAARIVSAIADANFEPAVVRATSDADTTVRKSAVRLLDRMNAKDAVASLIPIAESDPDEDVRIAACHALGTFGDASARAALQAIKDGDASGFVRDTASIALRRM